MGKRIGPLDHPIVPFIRTYMRWIVSIAVPVAILVAFLRLFFPPGTIATGYNAAGFLGPTLALGPGGGLPSDHLPSLANDNATVPGLNFSVPTGSVNGYRFFSDGDKLSRIDGWLTRHGVFQIRGHSYKPGGGEWRAITDERLIRRVAPFTPGLQQVLALNPVWYSYSKKLTGLNKNRGPYVGLIAQSVMKVLPYAVGTKDNGFWSGGRSPVQALYYSPSSLEYVLVNAVKELAAQNARLRDRVDQLEARLPK
uniref:Peptidase S74 domain-containing protein n=1 Tax=mine drainage metagenome TaxID=410659 RepID=E6PD85_9ZZZZ